MIINLLANTENVLSVSGNYFRVTDSDSELKVTFEGGLQSQTVSLARGMAFAPDGGFNRVRILSKTNQQINFESTRGVIDDNRISGRVNVVIESLAGIDTDRITLNEVVKLIVQPYAGRNRLQIKNAGTENAYIGNVNADSKGYELKPGEVLEIKRAGGAEIYAASNATGTVLHLFSELDTAQAVTVPSDLLTTESGAALLTESGEYLTV